MGTGTVKRAVVADDDAELRRLVALGLAREGFEVTEVADGKELLSLIDDVTSNTARRPDLIIADIFMPGCSGLKVVASMRRRNLEIPVVLITAFGDETTHALAKRLGAAALFDKPFDMVEIRRFAAALVGTAR
jgi:DNA-binding response OmpR family regulator